jgi:hypothetical protein
MESKTNKNGGRHLLPETIVIRAGAQFIGSPEDFKFNAADPFSIVKSLGEKPF